MVREYSARSVTLDYARIAWLYDVWSALTESKPSRQALEFAQIYDRARVLEVGLGTGLTLAGITNQNSKELIVGLDLSPAMLAHAKNRCK